MTGEAFARLVGWFRSLARARLEQAAARARALDAYFVPLDRTLRLELPSNEPAFPFQAELTVYFGGRRAVAQGAEPLAVAKGDISRRARRVAGALPVTAVDQCRAELELAVSTRRPAGDTNVQAWAHCVRLDADPDHQQAVADRQALTRQALIRDWRWEDEEQQITRLTTLLGDPLRATAWWLLAHGDRVDRVGDAADQFCRVQERLAPAAARPDASAATLGALVDEFCALDPVGGSDLARVVETVLSRQGSPGLADRIRRLDGAGAASPSPSTTEPDRVPT